MRPWMWQAAESAQDPRRGRNDGRPPDLDCFRPRDLVCALRRNNGKRRKRMHRRVILGAGLGLGAPALIGMRVARAQPRNAAWPRALNMGTAAPGGTYALYGPAWGQ